jgi:hypothetical protein
VWRRETLDLLLQRIPEPRGEEEEKGETKEEKSGREGNEDQDR